APASRGRPASGVLGDRGVPGTASSLPGGRSDVELDHVAVGNGMVAPDVLSVEGRFAPDTRVLERLREVLVHEPRDVLDGLAAVQDERTVPVGWTARRLRVDARDVEMAEQPRTDVSEAVPRRGRDGKRRIA